MRRRIPLLALATPAVACAGVLVGCGGTPNAGGSRAAAPVDAVSCPVLGEDDRYSVSVMAGNALDVPLGIRSPGGMVDCAAWSGDDNPSRRQQVLGAGMRGVEQPMLIRRDASTAWRTDLTGPGGGIVASIDFHLSCPPRRTGEVPPRCDFRAKRPGTPLGPQGAKVDVSVDAGRPVYVTATGVGTGTSRSSRTVTYVVSGA